MQGNNTKTFFASNIQKHKVLPNNRGADHAEITFGGAELFFCFDSPDLLSLFERHTMDHTFGTHRVDKVPIDGRSGTRSRIEIEVVNISCGISVTPQFRS